MATASITNYGNAGAKLLSKEVDFLNDTIKVILLKDTYTVDLDNHIYVSDLVLTANETSGTGYTAGGETLTTKSATYTATANYTLYNAADISLLSSSITARHAAIAGITTAESTSPLLFYMDFGSNQTTSSTEFKITWNASGIFAL